MVEWADGARETSLTEQDTDDLAHHGPNEPLGFEIASTEAVEGGFSGFAPEFYPDKFTQLKKRELDRYGSQCGGESVSLKAIKNREFHVEGVILQNEVTTFQRLLDYEPTVDLLSPLTPSGGMECHLKRGELKEQQGWDPHTRQWMFGYSLDLVSTGKDEHATGQNAIVSAIIDD